MSEFKGGFFLNERVLFMDGVNFRSALKVGDIPSEDAARGWSISVSDFHLF